MLLSGFRSSTHLKYEAWTLSSGYKTNGYDPDCDSVSFKKIAETDAEALLFAASKFSVRKKFVFSAQWGFEMIMSLHL